MSDAENAGRNDIASFFRSVMAQDSERASTCQGFLEELAKSGANVGS